MPKNNKIIDNLNLLKSEIKEACNISKRKGDSINLVAVSKTIESVKKITLIYHVQPTFWNILYGMSPVFHIHILLAIQLPGQAPLQ